jgi:hypothetical protein
MKHRVTFYRLLLVSILLASLSTPQTYSGTNLTQATQGEEKNQDKLIYADFEKTENGRVVSNRGGLVQIFTGQESTPVKFKGLPNASPGAPEIVRLKENDQNHLASFEYSLTGPNQWANVTLEVQGHPVRDGQSAADDVSGFKHLSVQLYATGVDSLRIEFLTHGQGLKLDAGPQLPVKVKPGLNTYLIPLKGLSQPSWVQERIDSKLVLKKLTAVSISAYCNACTPQNGTVIVDNVLFQK